MTHTESVIADFENHVNPSLAGLMRFMGFETVEERAEGSFVYDSEGTAYTDCLCGFGVFVLGHRPETVVAAVRDQLDKMPMASRLLFNEPQTQLAKRIAEITPGNLQYCFFGNSGAEAVDGALKLARFVKRRPKIVSTIGAFHGKTFGGLAASGRDVYKEPFAPMLPGFVHVEFGNDDALASAVDDETAAVILEPVQGEAGVIVPPPGYLTRAREICDEHGALLILDEVQTGLGRTGRMFACEHDGVVPDIMTLGKALGGGVMPIGAFVATPECWAMFKENPLIHSSTFGGNPMACRAGLAAIDAIVEGSIPERAAELGVRAKAKLEAIAAEHSDVISGVRGLGLMLGMSFEDSDFGGLVIAGLAQRKVLVGYTLNNPKVVRIQPPLTIEEELLDQVIGHLNDAIVQTKKMLADIEDL